MIRGRLSKDAATGRFPSFLEVAMRAAMLHSIYRERTAMERADLRLRPPIEPFRLMDFTRIDDIVAVGYASTRETVAGWRADAALRRLLQ
jgi:predicted acylesterase/phospholipase RssA